MRRIGYALFVLAGLSVVIAVVSLSFAISRPGDLQGRAVGYGLVNVGFAVVNAALGFVLLIGSRVR
jgi:hypothetical protein